MLIFFRQDEKEGVGETSLGGRLSTCTAFFGRILMRRLQKSMKWKKRHCLALVGSHTNEAKRCHLIGAPNVLKAAKQDLPEAQGGIGVMYMDGGGGVKKDENDY